MADGSLHTITVETSKLDNLADQSTMLLKSTAGGIVAKKRILLMLDDVDPSETADETVSFGLDGVEYEADLSKGNAAELRKTLRMWIACSRRVPTRRDRSQYFEASTSTAIRSWARENGYDVGSRGRVAKHILEAYNGSAATASRR